MKKTLLTLLVLTLSISMCACESKVEENNIKDLEELDRTAFEYFDGKQLSASAIDKHNCPECNDTAYNIEIYVFDDDDFFMETAHIKDYNFCLNEECENYYVKKAEDKFVFQNIILGAMEEVKNKK